MTKNYPTEIVYRSGSLLDPATGTIADVQDSPDTPDGLWITPATGAVGDIQFRFADTTTIGGLAQVYRVLIGQRAGVGGTADTQLHGSVTPFTALVTGASTSVSGADKVATFTFDNTYYTGSPRPGIRLMNVTEMKIGAVEYWPNAGTAITLRGAATATAASVAPASLNPAAPTGLTSTDLSILTVQGKHATAGVAPTITPPAGWNLITTSNNGLLGPTTDQGSNTVAVYYRVGTWTAAATTTTGFDAASAHVTAFHAIDSAPWDTSFTYSSGSATTAGTNLVMTAAGGLGVAPGDVVLVCSGFSGDAGGIQGPFTTVSGVLPLGDIRLSLVGVTTSTDARGMVVATSVAEGTSSAAPVFNARNTVSITGHAIFVRLRAGVVSAAAVPRNIRLTNAALQRSFTR